MPFWIFTRVPIGETPRSQTIDTALVQAATESEAAIKAVQSVGHACSLVHPSQSYETAELATASVRGEMSHGDYIAQESIAVDLSEGE